MPTPSDEENIHQVTQIKRPNRDTHSVLGASAVCHGVAAGGAGGWRLLAFPLPAASGVLTWRHERRGRPYCGALLIDSTTGGLGDRRHRGEAGSIWRAAAPPAVTKSRLSLGFWKRSKRPVEKPIVVECPWLSAAPTCAASRSPAETCNPVNAVDSLPCSRQESPRANRPTLLSAQCMPLFCTCGKSWQLYYSRGPAQRRPHSSAGAAACKDRRDHPQDTGTQACIMVARAATDVFTSWRLHQARHTL